MSNCRIGFYVHHHGRGHTYRIQEIIKHLNGYSYVFGTDLSAFNDLFVPNVSYHTLPPDTSDTSYVEDWPPTLHYAPLGIRNARKRAYALTKYFTKYELDLLVVDVSVEVALLARLCGIPVIYSRQHGYRQDAAHEAAFRSASSLLAPYPKAWEEQKTPYWVQDKTFYAGGFSRLANQALNKEDAQAIAKMPDHLRNVVVMIGFGGSAQPYELLEETARKNPQWHWWILGPFSLPPNLPQNLHFLGIQNNPYPYLKEAEVVIASAGNNTVMELAAMKARYICIPEARPFDEQLSKARLLSQKNAALVLPNWSEPSVWKDHLLQVNSTDLEALNSIITPSAAKRAAKHIEKVALSQHSPSVL
ncbi:MAG: glycosyltransferase [Bacteroidota bacterium]